MPRHDSDAAITDPHEDAPTVVPEPFPGRTAHPEATRGRHRQRHRRRRWLLLIAAPILGAIIWAGASYASYMTMPTSMTFAERSAEWVRADMPMGNWLVDQGEHMVYTFTAPKKGGPQLRSLPHLAAVDGAASSRTGGARGRAAAWPPRIRPIFPHPLPGEGVWKPTGPPVDGGPPVLVTTFRSELDYPRIVAYVAWFDHTRTDAAYYPGRYEPPNAALRGPMMVPVDQRNRLLATFNGGFIYSDGLNGSADNGRTNEPLKDGNATLIGYRDGRIAIVRWSGGPDVGSQVAWARQSLAPIVWNGRLNPLLNTDPNSARWGYTLGGIARVWRTGVGVDRRGNLIYAVANDQTVVTIARILQHAGAVRAMEFDINPEWHTLITYRHAHGLDPQMVEPQPMQPATRYLVPDDRDFVAIYRRRPGPVTVPFK